MGRTHGRAYARPCTFVCSLTSSTCLFYSGWSRSLTVDRGETGMKIPWQMINHGGDTTLFGVYPLPGGGCYARSCILSSDRTAATIEVTFCPPASVSRMPRSIGPFTGMGSDVENEIDKAITADLAAHPEYGVAA